MFETEERVSDLDAYVSYMTLKKYCECMIDSTTCLYCIFRQPSNPCCIFFKRKPSEFPSLMLNERQRRTLLESVKKEIERML